MMRQPARPRSLVAGDGFRALNQPGQLEVEMDAEKKPTAPARRRTRRRAPSACTSAAVAPPACAR